MNKKAIECILRLNFANSRLKAPLRPISLNSTSNNKPKLTFKIDYVA